MSCIHRLVAETLKITFDVLQIFEYMPIYAYNYLALNITNK